MRKILTLLFVTTLIISCGNDTSKKTTATEASTISEALTPASFPPVPEEFIVEMYNKIDHIDYYFRKTNFSVSQSTKEAVQAFIATLSPGQAPAMANNCVSPLRMTFLSEGNIIFETEMYMTENCMYVEYYIDFKKKYQSSYSQEGYNFLMNLIENAKKGR